MRAKIVALIGSVLLHSRPFARAAKTSVADPDEAQAAAAESSFLDSALAEIPEIQTEPPAPPGPQDRRQTGDVVDEDLTPPQPATRGTPAQKKPDATVPGKGDDKKTATPPAAAPAASDDIPAVSGDRQLPPTGDDDIDPELEKELDRFKAKSPQTEEGIGALKKFVREKNQQYRLAEKKIADDLKTTRKELDDLKSRVPSDDERARMTELRDFIRNTDIEHDPEFRDKYDKAVQRIDGDIIAMLQQIGMKDQVAKVISERGGIVKFSQSDAPVGPNFKNEDKSPMTESQFFEKYVFGQLSSTQQHQITHLLVSAKSKLRERDEEIARVKADAPKYIQERQEKVVKEFNNRAQGRLVDLVKALPEDMPRDVIPIPEKATKEERERIEEENKDFQAANDYILKMVTANTPEDRAEVAFYAAIGKHLLLKERDKSKKQASEWQERAETAEAKLEEITNSQRLSRHRNAPLNKNNQVPNRKMTDEEAVDAGLPG